MNLLISTLIHLLEAMFIVGIVGSAIVVLLTSVEDFEMLFERAALNHAQTDQS